MNHRRLQRSGRGKRLACRTMIVLVVLTGVPEFGATAETRWAGEILEREDLSGSDKMERIEDTYLLEREA